ncbi:MAG: tRNA (adenosine(37)-N6)-threonylcarbamoyltransferase complex ATPase subunit type 1 TsaE [Synechococcaceae cyanobacterium]|nr:tRNA (adenosine(37)-N6)-threonylcarbamoyltransferase complex ATPase subunit type 1 TsaE [Synechococcaceae cyanobacterium]
MNPDTAIEECHLADARATRELGRRLAERLSEAPVGARGGALLLLRGELGAGKTCLVQGLAEGLGISEPITSPTFALAQHDPGALDGAAKIGTTVPRALVHLDLYRLEQPAAADELFVQEEEEARAMGAVMAVEWPERLSFVPEGAWTVGLEIVGEQRWARITMDMHSADDSSAAGHPPGGSEGDEA